MSMRHDNHRALADNVARILVQDLAPQELLIFDDALEVWKNNPDPARLRGIGFGSGDLGTFVLPVALMAGAFLADILKDSAKQILVKRVGAWLQGNDSSDDNSVLSKSEIAAVVDGVKEKILARGGDDLKLETVHQILAAIAAILEGRRVRID